MDPFKGVVPDSVHVINGVVIISVNIITYPAFADHLWVEESMHAYMEKYPAISRWKGQQMGNLLWLNIVGNLNANPVFTKGAQV